MATNRELEQEVQQLRADLQRAVQIMEAAGLVQPPVSDDPRDRPDFVDFGPDSPKYAAMLGLVILEEGQEPPMGQMHIAKGQFGIYCLEDEIGAMGKYPGLSLDEAVPVILRQKINSYESGQPPVPANAPPMWTPEPLIA